MSLDGINKWLALAANLGVLAGIVFLGLEVRQNSEALLAGSRQDLLNQTYAGDPDFYEYVIEYLELRD